MTRELVYKAIDSERDYQVRMSDDPSRPDMNPHLSVGDTLSAIQYNLNKAHEAWYKGSIPHQETLDLLRKIAALCVQAGEMYGMPERKEYMPYRDLLASMPYSLDDEPTTP